MGFAKNQPFWLRLRYAWSGVVHALRCERSLRLQVAALAAVLIALAVFRPEPIWWALVALTAGAVISAELFNTAVEHLADHLHPDSHPQIRIVKDCAAAAVLIAACGALGVAIALAVHLMKGA